MVVQKPRWKRLLYSPALFLRHYRYARPLGTRWDAIVIAWKFTLINL